MIYIKQHTSDMHQLVNSFHTVVMCNL